MPVDTLDVPVEAEPALDVLPIAEPPIMEPPIEEKPPALPTEEDLKKIQEQLSPDLSSVFQEVEYCTGEVHSDPVVGALLVCGYNSQAYRVMGFAISAESIISGAYQETFKPSAEALLGVLRDVRWDP